MVVSVAVHIFIFFPLVWVGITGSAEAFSTGDPYEGFDAAKSRDAHPDDLPEPEKDKEEDDLIKPGIEDGSASTMTWIGYAEYEEHLARLAEVEQAAFTETPTGGGAPPSPPTPAAEGAQSPPQIVAAQPSPPQMPTEVVAVRPVPEPVVPAPAPPTPASEPDTIPAPEGPDPLEPAPLPPQPEPQPALTRPAEASEPTEPAPEVAPPEPPQPPQPQEPQPQEPQPQQLQPQQLQPPQPQPPAQPGATAPTPVADPTVEPPSPNQPAPSTNPAAGPPMPTSGPPKPGAQADKESDATSVVDVPPSTWRSGKPLAAKGLEIKTRNPVFPVLTQITTSPRSPVAEIAFDRTGKAVKVTILETSGYNLEIDEPVIDALFRWRAKGKQLDTLKEGQVVRMRVRVILK